MTDSQISKITPKAVVFDLGKVLLHFDFQLAVQAFSKKCPRPMSEVAPWFFESKLLLDYETGLITTAEFYSKIQSETDYSGTLEDFEAAFGPIFTKIDPMIEFYDRLKHAGIPCYIFSNTNDMAIRHIRETYPFFNTFTAYIFSYELKCMKPNKEIYDAVEFASRRSGPELFYIDDRLENIEAGAARGWQVCHHVDIQKTLDMADRLGLPGTGS